MKEKLSRSLRFIQGNSCISYIKRRYKISIVENLTEWDNFNKFLEELYNNPKIPIEQIENIIHYLSNERFKPIYIDIFLRVNLRYYNKDLFINNLIQKLEQLKIITVYDLWILREELLISYIKEDKLTEQDERFIRRLREKDLVINHIRTFI